MSQDSQEINKSLGNISRRSSQKNQNLQNSENDLQKSHASNFSQNSKNQQNLRRPSRKSSSKQSQQQLQNSQTQLANSQNLINDENKSNSQQNLSKKPSLVSPIRSESKRQSQQRLQQQVDPDADLEYKEKGIVKCNKLQNALNQLKTNIAKHVQQIDLHKMSLEDKGGSLIKSIEDSNADYKQKLQNVKKPLGFTLKLLGLSEKTDERPKLIKIKQNGQQILEQEDFDPQSLMEINVSEQNQDQKSNFLEGCIQFRDNYEEEIYDTFSIKISEIMNDLQQLKDQEATKEVYLNTNSSIFILVSFSQLGVGIKAWFNAFNRRQEKIDKDFAKSQKLQGQNEEDSSQMSESQVSIQKSEISEQQFNENVSKQVKQNLQMTESILDELKAIQEPIEHNSNVNQKNINEIQENIMENQSLNEPSEILHNEYHEDQFENDQQQDITNNITLNRSENQIDITNDNDNNNNSQLQNKNFNESQKSSQQQNQINQVQDGEQKYVENQFYANKGISIQIQNIEKVLHQQEIEISVILMNSKQTLIDNDGNEIDIVVEEEEGDKFRAEPVECKIHINRKVDLKIDIEKLREEYFGNLFDLSLIFKTNLKDQSQNSQQEGDVFFPLFSPETLLANIGVHQQNLEIQDQNQNKLENQIINFEIKLYSL